jgi:hypothetical protein
MKFRRSINNHPDDWRAFASLQGFVRLILLVYWDPIGILGYPGAMDEYDSYAPGVCDLLSSGASREALVDHLASIQREQIGIGCTRAELGIVAEKLLQAARAWGQNETFREEKTNE